MVEEVAATETHALERVVYLGTDGLGRRSSTAGRDLPRGRRYRERMSTLAPGDPINIQYTSGTTGLPQGRDAERTATS